MTARTFLFLNSEEIRKMIPYGLICETMGGSRWNTGKRRRAWAEEFTEDERQKCSYFYKKSCDWYLRYGAPDEIRMLPETLLLWQRLANFCYSI